MCTDKIASKPNLKYNVNMTLFHESVHIAQACKQNMKEIKPFGISPKDMNLSESLKKDLATSIKTFGDIITNTEKRSILDGR